MTHEAALCKAHLVDGCAARHIWLAVPAGVVPAMTDDVASDGRRCLDRECLLSIVSIAGQLNVERGNRSE